MAWSQWICNYEPWLLVSLLCSVVGPASLEPVTYNLRNNQLMIPVSLIRPSKDHTRLGWESAIKAENRPWSDRLFQRYRHTLLYLSIYVVLVYTCLCFGEIRCFAFLTVYTGSLHLMYDQLVVSSRTLANQFHGDRTCHCEERRWPNRQKNSWQRTLGETTTNPKPMTTCEPLIC